MPGPCLKARIFAKGKASTRSWTLPLWLLGIKSPTMCMAIGDHPIVLNKRIAEELNIKDGDQMEFEVYELGEEYCMPVHVPSTDITFDFLIHDAIFTEPQMIKSWAIHRSQNTLETPKGLLLDNVPSQEMFSSMKVIDLNGECIVHFDGGCRNNPKGPAGYGFCITSSQENEKLIDGYGYKSGQNTNNFMEYIGLIEGLIWAKRLFCQKVHLKGDSQLVIKQINGEYSINNPKLKKLRDETFALIEDIQSNGTVVTITSLLRGENTDADKLANQGMNRLENKVFVDWANVNKLMKA